jgi:hypothetical protein
MRRIASLLGMLAVAGVVAVALPSSASAASGVLRVNNKPYEDPSGCYISQQSMMDVINDTDQPVELYATPNCTGPVIMVIDPESEESGIDAQSVKVP